MEFLVPEILQLDEATIQSFIDSNNDLKRYEFDLKLINEKRPHIRCEYRKVINRSTRRTFNAFNVYGMFSNADLEFEDAIDKDGQAYPLTYRYIYQVFRV